jgi:DNA-binding protein YbaB
MSEYGGSAAEVTATIEAQVQASVDKAHKAYAFREEVDLLRGRGHQGSTRVTVDATGLLLAVEFDDRVRDRTPEALAAEVMGAVRAAQRDVAAVVSARTREVWGNDDPVTHQMDAELDKRFAPQDPDADRDDRDRRGGR